MWNWTENQIELYLIRHGMTPGNVEHRYIGGRTDEPLSEEGRQQLANRKKQMFEIQTQKKSEYEESICESSHFLSLFVSPMLRCRQTAEVLFPDQPQTEINAWREMDFGIFEGKNYQELNGDPHYQAWIDSGGTLAFPGGESREDFVERCVEGMGLVMENLRQVVKSSCISYREKSTADGISKPSPVQAAAIVHGGTIMALLSHYCGGDYFSYQVKNGEGYHLCLYLNEGKMELKGKL